MYERVNVGAESDTEILNIVVQFCLLPWPIYFNSFAVLRLLNPIPSSQNGAANMVSLQVGRLGFIAGRARHLQTSPEARPFSYKVYSKGYFV